ncbi:MAG: ABC transporter ATP-binding protein [Treponema sp.]|jgi:branched-chain amino acid transport system ATP-binding protein|nr:ABC transporter ATP-binding protein [Spirochaetota bacterium]NLH89948.1 ABC transporter ATP-binding protein [Treponema sp.]HNT60100.1 ABC transporter ATP-binding protein [Rectinema sp.]HOC27679.1 ABC transporter ATP-binding protein [Rectinema sp.]HPN92628.1 ABC transporter ATP-binding protein [Rectinema sp.]
MSEIILEVKDIHCEYDNVPVLHGVSLRVCKGEIVAMVGSNGAGKTTTLRTIAGLLHPVSGSIRFMGKDITRTEAYALVRNGISYIPEGRRLFGKLTVRQNLELGAYTTKERSVIQKRLHEVFRLFPILDERQNQTAETLSGGEQQMCAIARGLMSDPALLLLDEISLGLAPSLVEAVFDTIIKIRDQGITILLVEQLVQESLEIADRGYVIQTGRIVHDGPSHELLEMPEIRAAYMGM